VKRVAVFILLVLVNTSLLADTLTVRLEAIAPISGRVRGAERSRILFAFPLPERVRQSRIDFAQLQFPPVQIRDTSYHFTIEGYLLTTAWETRSVTWTRPWRNPGGDFDSARICRFTTAVTDSHPVILDITQAVKRWQESGNNLGLILKRPEYEGDGFGIEALPLRQVLNSARVRFYFTPVQE
jgi:hypothetical protein